MKHFERLALLAAICTLGACNEETYVEGDIKTIAATDVTDKSAVCGGALHIAFQGSAAELVIQETGIAWATSEDLLWEYSDEVVHVPAPNGGKEGSFSCKLEGLSPDSAYYFWAYANLKNAVEEYYVAGEVSKFTTLSPAGIKLTTLPATGITKTTAVAGGNITAVGRPPYMERGVCYATSSREPDIQSHTRKPAPGEGTGEYRVTLTGLTEGATYYVRAYATNGSEVAYGQTESFVAGGTLLTGGAATVALKDYVAISDGIYYYFSPSTNAKAYYFRNYSPSNLPGSDAEIVADMLVNGTRSAIEPDRESYEGYGFNLSQSTTYTLCMFAVDNQDRRGTLVKRQIATKSSTSQPRATITISSISGGAISYSIAKNSYCSSYTYDGRINLSDSDLDRPDIYWARYCYEDYKENGAQTANRSNTSWSGWAGACVITTLGFNSSNVNSGVIDTKFFSTLTNSVITKSVTPSPLIKQAELKIEKTVDASENDDKQKISK